MFVIIYGCLKGDRYSVPIQTENSYPMQRIIVLIVDAYFSTPVARRAFLKKETQTMRLREVKQSTARDNTAQGKNKIRGLNSELQIR